MHRAGKQSLAPALALALAGAAVAPSAWAFHAGNYFDKPPGAGGADGIFYTGAPLEHGWKCDLCHQSPPGQIAVKIATQPDLLAAGAYPPGQTVTFDVSLLYEHLGLNSPKSNYNSLVVKIVDDQGNAAGTLTGFSPDDFYQDFTMSTIASAGTKPGVTSWHFSWIAPQGGPVTLYVAAVDGNGADAGPGVTLTDPFNDDFISVALPLKDASKAASLDRRPPHHPGALACLAGLAIAGMVRRRRRRAIEPSASA